MRSTTAWVVKTSLFSDVFRRQREGLSHAWDVILELMEHDSCCRKERYLLGYSILYSVLEKSTDYLVWL